MKQEGRNRVARSLSSKERVRVRWFLLIVLIIIGSLLINIRKNHLPEITIGSASIAYEVVKTPEEIKRGLGGRMSLANDHGMLFIIDPPQVMTFWMKDMKFPLDFIWIKSGSVVDITEHVAAPLLSTSDNQLIKYESKTEVDHVLEVNAGFVEYYKIKIGDGLKGL